MKQPFNKALHRFSLATAITTFFLIIAGGLVTSTGSGLAVPDWPLSYGMLMPPMIGGIFYEHGHRMVATLVGFLTTILTLWLWKREQRRWMKVLGFVALTAVILQGALGGLTVLFLLPTAISVSHATLAQTFFCIVSSIALFTSRWWMEQDHRMMEESEGTTMRKLVVLTTASVYLQLILGALMRHTGSGLAVPDFPLAYGQLLPSLGTDQLAAYNRQLILDDIRLAADGSITALQIVFHLAHRFWAIVVTGMIVWLAFRLRRFSGVSKRLKTFSFILLGTLVVQLSLGAFTVLSRKSVDITTAHVATGAFLLVMCLLTTLHVFRLSRGKPFMEISYVPSQARA
ncbi:MAG: COX15/CtaA family protein [Ignavibacteriales bacterium]|nr:COX15/CtaA family protein [Ignavibacteriales bacterium]